MSGEATTIDTIFTDNFNNPLDPADWDFPLWALVNNPSFNGRTQYIQSLPPVSNGVLPLELYTYNPTYNPNDPTQVPSFYGTEIITHKTYSPGFSFDITAHFASPLAAGIVGGFFLYNYTDANNHNEIDFEALTNHPNEIQTNFYMNEPLGSGHPQSTSISTPLTDEHTYRIEWFQNAIRWFVDGQLVRDQTSNIPQHPMALYLDIYAPAPGWQYAYSSPPNPVTNASANTAYSFDINSVSIGQLPTIDIAGDKQTFNGNTGITTVLFSGNEANYSITQSGSGFSIKDNVGIDGTETVININTLLFSDQTLTIVTNPSNTLLESYRIYKAAFDRAPDYGGLGYWYNVMNHGASLGSIADGFIHSNEFTSLYGSNPTDSTLITLLYQNVLGRTPDQAGYVYWMNDLQHNISRADILVSFSESPENIANLAGIIAHGIIYESFAT